MCFLQRFEVSSHVILAVAMGNLPRSSTAQLTPTERGLVQLKSRLLQKTGGMGRDTWRPILRLAKSDSSEQMHPMPGLRCSRPSSAG